MRYKRLDLNLLVALDALLTTRSVSKAAALTHITQPAMSGALARLRTFFGDPLLIPVGRSMELSPFAIELIESVKWSVDSIDRIVLHRPQFDPATVQRNFVVAASGDAALTILQPAIASIVEQAPGVTITIISAAPAIKDELLTRRELDFIIVRHEMLSSEHPYKILCEDELVCIVWSGNKKITKKLTREQYARARHVVTRYGAERRGGAEAATLEHLGISRIEEVSCPTSLLLAPLVVGTNRIATVGSRLAHQQAGYQPIRILAAPISFPRQKLGIQWHSSRCGDGGLRWLRDVLSAVALEIPGTVRGGASKNSAKGFSLKNGARARNASVSDMIDGITS